MGQSFDSSRRRNPDLLTTLPRTEMPGRREAKELEACLGRAADYDPMYLEGTGGFPSDGAVGDAATAPGGEAFERANLAKSCATHA